MSSADQLKSISKQRLKAEAFLFGIIRAVFSLHSAIGSATTLEDGTVAPSKVLTMRDLREDTTLQISIKFDESFFHDEHALMAADSNLVTLGLMPKRDFMLKYGIATVDNVDEKLEEIRADAPAQMGGFF